MEYRKIVFPEANMTRAIKVDSKDEDKVATAISKVLDEDKTVLDVVKEVITKTGENIKIRRFIRYERGEGLEKRVDNFAEEVMKQM